jgi:hypothetical protein
MHADEDEERKQSPAPTTAGVTDEGFDDILVRTPGFQAMIAHSHASLSGEAPISAEDLLAEARAALANEPQE